MSAMFKRKVNNKNSGIDNSNQGSNNDNTNTATSSGKQKSYPVVTGTASDNQQQQRRKDDKSEENLFDLNPKVTEPLPKLTTNEEVIYKRLKKGQYMMDESITLPILNRKIGLDPIIGLIPVIGTFASAGVSLSLVAMAAPVLSKYTVIRMLINVCIDTLIGLIPFIGSIFDIGWKANERNVKIFEKHMAGSSKRRDVDRQFIWTAVTCVVLFLLSATVTFVGLVFMAMWWLYNYFT